VNVFNINININIININMRRGVRRRVIKNDPPKKTLEERVDELEMFISERNSFRKLEDRIEELEKCLSIYIPMVRQHDKDGGDGFRKKLLIENKCDWHYEIIESVIVKYNEFFDININYIDIYVSICDNKCFKEYLITKYPKIRFENIENYDYYINCTIYDKDFNNIDKGSSTKKYISHEITERLKITPNVYFLTPLSKTNYIYTDILPFCEKKEDSNIPIYILQGNLNQNRRYLELLNTILDKSYNYEFTIKVIGHGVLPKELERNKNKIILKNNLNFIDYHKEFLDAYCILPLISKKTHPKYYTDKLTSTINYSRGYKLKTIIDKDLQDIYGLDNVEIYTDINDIAKSFEKTLEDFYNYDIFKNTYLINMETRRDRHLFMDYKLKNMGINYKRIPGVIGKHFEEEFNEFKKINNTFNSVGAYGIFLTYKNIISKLYSLDSHVVIFEDDIVFHKDFHKKIKKYKQLIVNTDVVWLGVNRAAWGNNIKESNNEYFVADVTNYPDYLNWGAYGIIYSSRFLRALDKEINGNIENINLIDKFISYVLKKNPQFTNVAFKPDLIIPQVYESDNMGQGDMEKMSIERRWDLNNLHYLNETAYFKDYYTKIMNNYSLRNDEKKDIENTLSNYDISKIVEDNNKSFVFFYKFNNIESLERFINSVNYQDYVFYRIYILCSDDEWSVINDTDILISMENKVKNIEGELTKSILLNICYADEICILLKGNEFIVNIKDTLRLFSLTCRDSNVCLSYNNTYYNINNEKLDHYHDVQITTDNNDIVFFRSISINYLEQEYNDIEDIYLFFDSDKRTENNENMNDKKLLKLINPLNKGKHLDLTIGIPVYKLEDYTFLHTLCDSLKDKNIEIIFMNDKQNKDEELIKLSEKYENIYVLNNGTNQGAGISRNRILNHTFIRGEYLYFFDADDFLYIDNFLTCLKIIMDKKYDVLYFKWKINDKINHTQEKLFHSFKVAKENIISPGIGMTPWWHITKSSIVLNNKIRFGETQIQNDVNYGVLVIHYSEKLHFEDVYVVKYNKDNPNNITNSKKDRSSTIISSYNTICQLKQIKSPLFKRFIHCVKYGIYPWNRQKTNNLEEYDFLYNLYLSSYVDKK
jgi:GR25 family glycosyltransferase involved in LPS biosynthesis